MKFMLFVQFSDLIEMSCRKCGVRFFAAGGDEICSHCQAKLDIKT